MSKSFCIDSTSPISYCEIRDYLFLKLKPIIDENRPIIFLCIGTDRSTGDSLGPIIGYKLKSIARNNFHIYGSLESPIHALNLTDITTRIKKSFKDPYIIAIDACLGKINNVGKIFIEEKPLCPGLALNKNLESVGDMSITGIVNISGALEFMVLQNTRLYTVMTLADSIYKGIYHFILKTNKNNNSIGTHEDTLKQKNNFSN